VADAAVQAGAGPGIVGRLEGAAPGLRAAGPILRFDVMAAEEADELDRPDPWWMRLERGVILVFRPRFREAFWGELSTALAAKRGVAGVVVLGASRDRRRVAASGLPVFAEAWSPGDWPGKTVSVLRPGPADEDGYVDDDGLVTWPAAKTGAVLRTLAALDEREALVLGMIERGATPREVLKRWGAL
jgi:hypothetical protein